MQEKIKNEFFANKKQIELNLRILDINHQKNIDLKSINNIYEELDFFIPKATLEHIEGVKKFHNDLYANRCDRANNKIVELKEKNKKLQELII